MRSSTTLPARALASAALVLASLVLLAAALVIDWPSTAAAAESYILGGLLVALALAMAASGLTAMAWRALLWGLGNQVRRGDVTGTFYLTRVGTYLPGSPWAVYADDHLRLDLRVSSADARTSRATHDTVRATLGLSWGLAFLVLPLLSAPVWASLTAALVPIVLLVPDVLERVRAWVGRALKNERDGALPTTRGLLGSILWQATAWLVSAFFLATLVGPYSPLGQGDLGALIGAVGLSWVAGTVGAAWLGDASPDGLGVADLALWLCLLTLTDPGAAAMMALAARVIVLIADMTLASIASTSTGFRRWREHRPA